jgi:hypothetical protein
MKQKPTKKYGAVLCAVCVLFEGEGKQGYQENASNAVTTLLTGKPITL